MDETPGIAYEMDEWPWGLRCSQCARVFAEGERYSTRLTGFLVGEDAPAVVEVVCVSCARGQPQRSA
jgi:hypothetical protein